MKLFIKLYLFSFLFGGLLLLFLPISLFPSFYDVRYMGVAAIVGALVIYFVPKLLQVPITAPQAREKNQAVHLVQLLLVGIIGANALGDLGLYQLYRFGFEFDKFIHFLTPFLSIIFLPLVIHIRFEVHLATAIQIAFVTILFCAIGWEWYESFADRVFKTHLSGVYGLSISQDTKLDLISDLLGTAFGLCLWKWFPHQLKKFVK